MELDVDHHAASSLDHLRQQKPVETHGSQQVDVEFRLPELLGRGGKPSARCRRSAHVVNDNIHASELFHDGVGNRLHALEGGDIGLDKEIRMLALRQRRAGRGCDNGAGLRESPDDSLARPLCPSGDKNALPGEFSRLCGGRFRGFIRSPNGQSSRHAE